MKKTQKKIVGVFLASLLIVAAYSVTEQLSGFRASAQKSSMQPPVRGNEKAPVTITEYADFLCPFCKRGHKTMQQVLSNYPGKVKFVFRHYPLSLDPDRGSLPVHHASACAQEQNNFWEFHDRVFEHAGGINRDDLMKIANEAGLNQGAFERCMEEGRYHEFLLRERQSGTQKGISGTPAFFINEYPVFGALPYAYFEQIINSILEPEKYDLPEDLKARIRGPEPVTFEDLSTRPAKGPEAAPVTLVEFSDYHCPFCRKLSPTLSQLMEEHADKIRRVFRHYPLDMHPVAKKVHEAAECAHEQGRFWDYHQALMTATPPPKELKELVSIARDQGLDAGQFQACLESGKYAELIQEDIQAGIAAGVRGTPAVFVNGKLISGAQPYALFNALIQQELQETNKN